MPSSPKIPLAATSSKKRKREESSPATSSPLRKQVATDATEEPDQAHEATTTNEEHTPRESASPAKSAASDGSTQSSRNKGAVTKAKQRDSGACVLSGVEGPDTAHIFPFSASTTPTRRELIDRLVSFWGKATFTKWRKMYSDRSATEPAQNLICLNQQLHLWWGSCRLALKPVRTLELNAIKVQLHWLQPSSTTPEAVVDSPSVDTHCLQAMWGDGNDSKSWGRPPVVHRKSGLPLGTGQLFTIRAKDPADLPSFELLEMQWYLMRLAAMAGAADVFFD